MKEQSFTIIFLLMLVAQIAISNWFNVTPYITLTILPAMILCIPIRLGTSAVMLIALVTGLLADFLTEGVIGLNAAALVPVGFVRKTIIRFIFGEDLLSRGDDFSIRRYGFGKVSFALIIAQTLFLIIFILLDSGGTRTLWFNIFRFMASLALGFAVSIFVVDQLTPDDRKRQ